MTQSNFARRAMEPSKLEVESRGVGNSGPPFAYNHMFIYLHICKQGVSDCYLWHFTREKLMKPFCTLLCALVCCLAASEDALAGIVITDSQAQVYAYVFAAQNPDGFLGDFDVTDANNVNRSFTDMKTLSFGSQGDQGQYSYTYETKNNYSDSGSQIHVSSFVSMNIDASTKLDDGETDDYAISYMHFTTDETYQAKLDFSCELPILMRQTLDVWNALQTVPNYIPHSINFGYEAQTFHGGPIRELGVKSLSFELPPGDYVFGAYVKGKRFGPLDFQDLEMSSSSSLTLTPVAVPEPTGLAVLGCVGAIALAKLRRKLL